MPYLMIACALPLAACNKPEVNEKNASVAEVAEGCAKRAAGESFIRAGQWQSKVHARRNRTCPGMPPQMAQAEMKR